MNFLDNKLISNKLRTIRKRFEPEKVVQNTKKAFYTEGSSKTLFKIFNAWNLKSWNLKSWNLKSWNLKSLLNMFFCVITRPNKRTRFDIFEAFCQANFFVFGEDIGMNKFSDFDVHFRWLQILTECQNVATVFD